MAFDYVIEFDEAAEGLLFNTEQGYFALSITQGTLNSVNSLELRHPLEFDPH